MKFKTYTKINEGLASIEKQQRWEQELEDIGLELQRQDISEFTRKRLEKREAALQQKFAKQRELEKGAAKNESIADMHKRCEECNTLLNDSGTCPKCDHGEEDYGDSDTMEEALSNKEKLKRAYPELNFDIQESIEVTEAMSAREKLKRAYPELNFEETVIEEGLSNREKLQRAYPELEFDKGLTETVDPSVEEEGLYDDDYYELDDVEQDRVHSSLFGGDRTYCSSCGHKLSHNEWGSYCPECEPEEELRKKYDDEI